MPRNASSSSHQATEEQKELEEAGAPSVAAHVCLTMCLEPSQRVWSKRSLGSYPPPRSAEHAIEKAHCSIKMPPNFLSYCSNPTSSGSRRGTEGSCGPARFVLLSMRYSHKRLMRVCRTRSPTSWREAIVHSSCAIWHRPLVYSVLVIKFYRLII